MLLPGWNSPVQDFGKNESVRVVSGGREDMWVTASQGSGGKSGGSGDGVTDGGFGAELQNVRDISVKNNGRLE